jgi:hypothetical protein
VELNTAAAVRSQSAGNLQGRKYYFIPLRINIVVSHTSRRLGYGLDVSGFDSRQKNRPFFISKQSSVTLENTQPAIQLASGVLSLGVKLCLGPRIKMDGAVPLLHLRLSGCHRDRTGIIFF